MKTVDNWKHCLISLACFEQQILRYKALQARPALAQSSEQTEIDSCVLVPRLRYPGFKLMLCLGYSFLSLLLRSVRVLQGLTWQTAGKRNLGSYSQSEPGMLLAWAVKLLAVTVFAVLEQSSSMITARAVTWLEGSPKPSHWQSALLLLGLSSNCKVASLKDVCQTLHTLRLVFSALQPMQGA